MSEEILKDVVEKIIVIDRCLNHMFYTAIEKLPALYESMQIAGITTRSSGLFEVKHAPTYAAVCAIKPISDAMVFEEGDEGDITSGHLDIESSVMDENFYFEVPYTYGDFAVILLEALISLNNTVLEHVGIFEEESVNDLTKVINLLQIHKSLAEGEISIHNRQWIIDGAYFANKILNDLVTTDE